MRKKILFLVQLPPPVHGASLMNKYVVNSTLIQSKYNSQKLILRFADSLEDIGKLSIKKLVTTITVCLKLISKLVFFRPQLVYFTIAPSGAAFYRDFLFAVLIKISRSRLVFHIHGNGFAENSRKSKLYRYLCKQMFKNTYCIHLSKNLMDDVPYSGIKKRYIVPNGIPEIHKSQNERKTNNGIIRLLNISNYIKAKGILDLIDAIEKVVPHNNKFHLKLVGKPFDLSIDYLNDYIEKKDLQSYISVCGPRYDEDKYEELRNADLFIFPTYYSNEAFPLVLLEAFDFAVPCISTNHGGITDIIDNGINGLIVPPGNITSLAEQIVLLLDQPDMLNKMGKNAKKKFLEKYTLQAFENNLAEVFDDIIKRNN